MTTILLGAGASVPFFTPGLNTWLLTDAIKNRDNWQNVLDKYNHVECDKGTRRATPTEDEIMLLIDTIVTYHPNYNFEQIAEVVDKYCSIKIDAIEQKTMLSSISHLVNTLSGKNDISHDKRWRNVPFLLREIIANKIIDTQTNHHAENYDQLQKKQDEFLQLVCKQDEEVSIISLNYDDCIVESARHLNFDLCFTLDKDKGFIQNAPAILNSKKVILFPHGHLRLCPFNNGTTEFFYDSVIADGWRWDYLFDTITDGTATYTPATFAYNFNTFITTGQTKDDCLNNEPFAAYYQRMAKDLLSSDRVIIIGYSFSDEHINRFLKSFLHSNPNNKVLVIDWYDKNIMMTEEYLNPDCIITKIQRVFSPEWSICVNHAGNKYPLNQEQVQKSNKIGYGEIFANVMFYKKGYLNFLQENATVLQEVFSNTPHSLCDKFKKLIKSVLHNVFSTSKILIGILSIISLNSFAFDSTCVDSIMQNCYQGRYFKYQEGDSRKAIPYFESSYNAFCGLGNHTEEPIISYRIECLNYLYDSYMICSMFTNAETCLSQMDEIYKTELDTFNLSYALNLFQFADFYEQVDAPQVALMYYKRAALLYAQLDKSNSVSFSDISIFIRFPLLDEKTFIRIPFRIGHLYKQQGNLALAEYYLSDGIIAVH